MEVPNSLFSPGNPFLPFQQLQLLSQSAIRTLGGFIFGEHQVLSGLCCHIPWFSFCFNSWVHPQGVLHSDAQTEPCEMLGFALLEHLHQNERTQQQSVRLKFSLCQRCGTNDLDISLRSASFTPWQSQGQSTAQEFATFQWCEKFVNPSRGNSSWTITNLLPWVHDKCHRLLKFAFSNSASQPRAKFKKKKNPENPESATLKLFVMASQLFRIYLVLNETWHLHHIRIWVVHSQNKRSYSPPIICRTANWNYLWEKM